MCSTCGCGKPKDKHGMKTLAAANKKYSKNSKQQAAIAVAKKAKKKGSK